MRRIDILPDDVLLGIFDFYVDMSLSYIRKTGIEAWQSLAHVCRQMEKPCSWIATSPESAAFVYTRNTRKGHDWISGQLRIVIRGDVMGAVTALRVLGDSTGADLRGFVRGPCARCEND